MTAVLAVLALNFGALHGADDDMSLPKALRTQANRFRTLAIKGDIKDLMKLCAPSVDCLEIFRVTPRSMYGDQGSFFDKKLDAEHDNFGYQVRKEVVDPAKLDRFHRDLVVAFCKYIKDSAAVPDYTNVRRDDLREENLTFFPGVGLWGKIASNAMWRVDFVLIKGRWLATKFVVAIR